MKYLNYNDIGNLLNNDILELNFQEDFFKVDSLKKLLEMDNFLKERFFTDHYNLLTSGVNCHNLQACNLHFFKYQTTPFKFKFGMKKLKKNNVYYLDLAERIKVNDPNLMMVIFPSNNMEGKFVCLKNIIHANEIQSYTANIPIYCLEDFTLTENDNILSLKFFY